MGIYGFPGQTALPSNLICAILAGLGLYRRLTKFEIATFFFFAGGSIIAQARTHVPGLILITLVFLYGLSKFDRQYFRYSVGLLAFGLTLMFTVGANKMAYLIGTDWFNDPNLVYRRERAWLQADLVWDVFPLTGIGPEARYWGDTRGLVDKWTPHAGFDNGWLLIRASYGLVGVILMAIAIGVWTLGPLRNLRNKVASAEQRGLIVAMSLSAICIALGMYGNNILTWEPSMLVFFVLAGIIMPTQEEELATMRDPFDRARLRAG